MDDLRPQAAEHRLHALGEAIERGDHDRTVRVDDDAGVRALIRGARDVPGDLVARGGVEEAAQPAAHQGGRARPVVERPVVELVGLRMVAAEEREQTGEAGPAGVVLDRAPERAVARRDTCATGRPGSRRPSSAIASELNSITSSPSVAFWTLSTYRSSTAWFRSRSPASRRSVPPTP